MLGYIHPFPDGNGRIARFLMNALLAAGRYPWVVIRTEARDLYMDALARASTEADIGPFAAFLGERMRRATDDVAWEEGAGASAHDEGYGLGARRQGENRRDRSAARS